MRIQPSLVSMLVMASSGMLLAWIHAADWPMLGRDNTRNGVSTEINSPTYWRVVDTEDKERRLLARNQMSGNVKWSVQLGSGVQNLVTIESEDIFAVDLSKATVITAFLYPRLLEKLVPQFRKLQPGSRILRHFRGFGRMRL